MSLRLCVHTIKPYGQAKHDTEDVVSAPITTAEAQPLQPTPIRTLLQGRRLAGEEQSDARRKWWGRTGIHLPQQVVCAGLRKNMGPTIYLFHLAVIVC